MLDSGRVQTFLTVARERGFSRAARALGKTQSSISQAVSLLERELGVLLFERQGRAVTLTDNGRLFLPHAERLMEDMERARAELQSAGELRSGELLVGTSDTLACHLLPPVLATFRQRFPGVNLRLFNRPSPATAEGVAARALHVGVVSLPLPADQLLEHPRGRPRARLEVLARQQDVLICPPAHPLSRRRRVPLSALAGQPLLLLDRTTAGRLYLESVLAALPASQRPVVAMEMGSVEVLKRLTQLGFGLSVVPAWAVEAEVAAGLLVARPLAGLAPRSVGLCLPSFDPLPPATAAFAAIARELLARRNRTRS